MSSHTAILAWAVFEFILAVPLLGCALILPIAGSLRRIRSLPPDTYLEKVASPFNSAITATMVSAAVTGLITRSWYAAPLIVGALFVQFYIGGEIARFLQHDGDDVIVLLDRQRRDVEHLKSVYRVTRDECALLQRRAAELQAAARRIRAEPCQSRFRSYWRGRKWQVRLAACAWGLIAVYGAARQAWLMHSAWYLASAATGASWIAAAWIVWRLQRKSARADADRLATAADVLRRHLEELPHTATFGERLHVRPVCTLRHARWTSSSRGLVR